MTKLSELKRLRKNNSAYAGYHIHHIDWNHNNNADNNLILVSPKVHEVIHQESIHDKDDILKLIKLDLLAKKHNYEELKELLNKDPRLQSISGEIIAKIRDEFTIKRNSTHSQKVKQFRLDF